MTIAPDPHLDVDGYQTIADETDALVERLRRQVSTGALIAAGHTSVRIIDNLAIMGRLERADRDPLTPPQERP